MAGLASRVTVDQLLGGTYAGGRGRLCAARGTHKPASNTRAAPLRECGYERLHILEEIAESSETASRDRIAAIGLMLEPGLRGDVSTDDLRAAIVRTLEVIQESVAPDVADMLIRKIRPIWRMGG